MNKSIEGYKIFRDDSDFKRFIKAMVYYSYERSIKISLKQYIKIQNEKRKKN